MHWQFKKNKKGKIWAKKFISIEKRSKASGKEWHL
jgi:hypothetical protein